MCARDDPRTHVLITAAEPATRSPPMAATAPPTVAADLPPPPDAKATRNPSDAMAARLSAAPSVQKLAKHA